MYSLVINRRSDPTAGHIMVGMGDLLPPRLPPLNSVTGSFDLASGTLTGSIYSPGRMREDGVGGEGGLPGQTRLLSQRSLQSNSMLTSSLTDPRMGQDGYDHALMQQSVTDGSLLSSQEQSAESYHHSGHHGYHERSHYLERIDSEGAMAVPPRESPSTKSKVHKAKSPTHIPFANTVADKTHKHSAGHNGREHSGDHHSHHMHRPPSAAGLDDQTVDSDRPDSERRSSLAQYTEDLMLLISRPFALPFESKNCLVQVYTSKTYDENVYLKVVTSGISPQILCERPLQIDKAYEVVNAAGNSSSLMHGSDNEDLATLSALLINMFQDADDDGSGECNMFEL